MSKLVAPHGGKGLVCCLLEGAALEAEKAKAAGLKQIEISDRAKGDLIMMGRITSYNVCYTKLLRGVINTAAWKCQMRKSSEGWRKRTRS